MTYEDALENALRLRNDRAALESLLAEVPQWRPRLEADLRLSRIARDRVQGIGPTVEAEQRARRQLLGQVAVLQQRNGIASADSLSSWWRPLRLIGAPVLVAATVIVALALLLPGGNSLQAPGAAAFVVEGAVQSVAGDQVTLTTSDGPRTFRLAGARELKDGFGNPVSLADLRPGQIVVLTGNAADGTLRAHSLEVKDRLFGTVTAVTVDSVTLSTSGGTQYVIRIAPQTRLEGLIQPGATVEVDVDGRQDGSLWAKEIEVEDRGGGTDNSGPGSGSDNRGPGSGDDNSGPGSGDDNSGGDDDGDNSGPGRGDREDGDRSPNSGPGSGRG